MRCIYHVVVSIGFGAHYALVLCLPRSCAPCHIVYVPMVLLFVSGATFTALVRRMPDTPPLQRDVQRADDTVPPSGAPDGGAFHCKLCRRVVVDFDHHCDVLDMCIGRGNIQRFRLFLVYHASLCAYALTLHKSLLSSCVADKPQTTRLLLILLVFEFSMAVAVGCFAAFHVTLCVCQARTYDVVQWYRRRRVGRGRRVQVHVQKTE